MRENIRIKLCETDASLSRYGETIESITIPNGAVRKFSNFIIADQENLGAIVHDTSLGDDFTVLAGITATVSAQGGDMVSIFPKGKVTKA